MGRHAIGAPSSERLATMTPQQAYREQVGRDFGKRLKNIPKFTVVATLVLWPIISLITVAAKKGGVGDECAYVSPCHPAVNAGPIWGGVFLIVLIGSAALATFWALWMGLLETFPTATALLSSFGAGRNLAQGNLARAGADGYSAAYFAKKAAQKRGEEWVGGIMPGVPGSGATATPEAFAGGIGLVAGMAHNHKETMDALRDLKGQ